MPYKKIVTLIFLPFFGSLFLLGSTLPHMGRVISNGKPFEGEGSFWFALINDANQTVWNHEGSADIPNQALKIPVQNGFYQIGLGDQGIPGMSPLDPSLLLQWPNLKLRIWFDDGINGIHKLGQDQPLDKAPYSIASDHLRDSSMMDSMFARLQFLEGENNKSMATQINALGKRMDDLNVSGMNSRIEIMAESNQELSRRLGFTEGNLSLASQVKLLNEYIDDLNISDLNDRMTAITDSNRGFSEKLLKVEDDQRMSDLLNVIVRQIDDLNKSLHSHDSFIYPTDSNFTLSRIIPTEVNAEYQLGNGLQLMVENDGQNLYLILFDRGQAIEATAPLSAIGTETLVSVTYDVSGPKKGLSLLLGEDEVGHVDPHQMIAAKLDSNLSSILTMNPNLGQELINSAKEFFGSFKDLNDLTEKSELVIRVVQKGQRLTSIINKLGVLLEHLKSMHEVADKSRLKTGGNAWKRSDIVLLRENLNQFVASLTGRVNRLVNPDYDPMRNIFELKASISEPIQGTNLIFSKDYQTFGLTEPLLGIEGNGTLKIFADEVDMSLPSAQNEKFNIVNTTYILPDVLSELNSTYGGFPKQSNWSDYYQDMTFYSSGERMKNLTNETDINYPGPDGISGNSDDGRSLLMAHETIPFRLGSGEPSFVLGDNFSFHVTLSNPENLALSLRLNDDFTPENILEFFTPLVNKYEVRNLVISPSFKFKINNPRRWKRLNKYLIGDLVTYFGKLFQSQSVNNVNRRPGVSTVSPWKEINPILQIDQDDLNMELNSVEKRHFYIIPDGQLFEDEHRAVQATINIILNSQLAQQGTIANPEQFDQTVMEMVREVEYGEMSFEWNATEVGGVSYFDSYSMEYQLYAEPDDSVIKDGLFVKGSINRINDNLSEPGSVVKLDGFYYLTTMTKPVNGFNSADWKTLTLENRSGFGAFFLGDTLPVQGEEFIVDFESNSPLNIPNHTFVCFRNDARFFVTVEEVSGLTVGNIDELLVNPSFKLINTYFSRHRSKWSLNRIYDAGQVVFYQGAYYECQLNNFNNRIDSFLGEEIVRPGDRMEGADKIAWKILDDRPQYIFGFSIENEQPSMNLAFPSPIHSDDIQAEGVPILDVTGQLVGFRITESGLYHMDGNESFKAPHYQSAKLFYSIDGVVNQEIKVDILWKDLSNGEDEFLYEVIGLDFVEENFLTIDKPAPFGIKDTIQFRLEKKSEHQLVPEEGPSLASTLANLDLSSILPFSFLESDFFEKIRNQAITDYDNIDYFYPHAPGAAESRYEVPDQAEITTDMLSDDLKDRLTNTHTGNDGSSGANTRIAELEEKLDRALNRIEFLESTKDSNNNTPSNIDELENIGTTSFHLAVSAEGMEMIWVEPGTFIMGQDGFETVHEVTLTQGFYLGKYELTNGQYEAVTGRSTIDQNTTDRGKHPVGLNWHEAEKFCAQLTALERDAGRLLDGWVYVLPTEAEWEYACRAGTTTTYYYGDDFNYSMSWSRYSDNGRIPRDSLEVGQYPSNPWGFHDMYGNTLEWTADWHTYYLYGPVIDPVGPASGTERVFRGGGYGNSDHYSRSSVRWGRDPQTTYAGLRVALKKTSRFFTGEPITHTIQENSKDSIFLLPAVQYDPTLILSFSHSGPDADKFNLNASTGELSFLSPPDYESNASASGNNEYRVTITATDGILPDSEEVVITVTDLFESSKPDYNVQSAAGLEMIWVEPGTFIMGQEGYETVHEVTLTEGFYMGKYELTNAEYEAVLGISPIDINTTGKGSFPVDTLSWKDAEEFCARLTLLEQEAGHLEPGWIYDLPTEAQWEYVCRAGTTTTYYYGDKMDYSLTWSRYSDNGSIPYRTIEVGGYPANPWGFYDMIGNVAEWTADWYGNYSSKPVTDPTGPLTGSVRVARGGTWGNSDHYSRSATRHRIDPAESWLGFRLVLKEANAKTTQNDHGSLIDGNDSSFADVDVGRDITKFFFSVALSDDEIPTLTIEAELSLKYSQASSIAVLYWLRGNDQTWVYPKRDSDGVFRMTQKLNSFLASGTYVVRAVSVKDNSGDELRLGEEELKSFNYAYKSEFTNPNSDNTPPIVESFTMTPFNYDSSEEKWSFTYELNASDDMSGLQDGHIVELVNGTGTSLQDWGYFDENGSATITRTFEKYIPSNTYLVNTIRIFDDAGNDGTVFTQGLKERGLPYQLELNNTIFSDEELPVLLAFSMNSDAKSETDRYVVKLVFNAQDEGSGYDKAYLRVKDEYGTLYDHWVYSQSDGEQSFSFSMRSGFMGKLMVDYFTIYDRAENAKKYDKETMDTLGFKTTSYVGILTSVVDGNQTITLPDSNGSNSLPLESNNTLTVDLNASVALEMIWVEPGIFMMGQVGVAAPVHEVTLTEGFYLGKFEVTQAQYEAVMTGNADGLSATPSNFGGYPNYPVEQVSYNDVQVFLSRLNNIESANIPAGWAYVLPTEAQWEYACRAGTVTDYSWGNDINASQANYDSNYGRPLNVGQYAPNPWGFFDMHGNIIEWTADWDGTYPTGNPVVDPTGPASGSYRVIRGGSWSYPGTYLRSARRGSLSPSPRNNDLGFRVGFKKQ